METADLALEPGDGGTAFYVKAHAGARRDRIAGVHAGMVKVEVTTAPEKGKANKAIIRLLARELGMAPAALRLLSGETNPKKRLLAAGVDGKELARRFAAL